ncbi:glycosyltransferase family 4 protein [Chryseobacterium sp. 6424]|uniref:glycosyltransferase family 4 protein n=1 Tax=Chryseobacterium sp. 6424 TaxID=2039166 RepID=UPI001E5ABFDA|nr:glycosyltransferase family 4 protein [Chryseobacterium sp. 6424]
MRNSSLVIAGNQYLAEKAKRSGAKRVEKIPTVVDLERYQMKERFSSQNEPLVIGWIGTFSTFKYVKSLIPVFEKLAEKIPLKLHIIGAKEDLDTFLEIKFIDWEEHLEASSIRTFDVGIMPLEDSRWEKGKCGYKLIQYMASGIPVIASPVGVNSEIVENNINGYLAKTVQDWEDKVLYLHENRNLLQILGAAGRKKVEETYSLQVTSNKLLQIVDGFNI